MKKVLFVILSVLFICDLYSIDMNLIKTINLNEMGIIEPKYFFVKNGGIYVFDKINMEMYVIKDYKLVRKFGNKEFKRENCFVPFSVGFVEDRIYVYFRKRTVVYFDINGNYLGKKEPGKNDWFFKYKELPENKILAVNLVKKSRDYIYKVLIFRQNNKTIKIFSSLFSLKLKFDLTKTKYFCWTNDKDNLYIVPDKNFYKIMMFDFKSGKVSLFVEKKDYQRVKISEDVLKEFRKESNKLKQEYPVYKNANFRFPEYKAAISGIFTNNKDLVFVVTNEIVDGRYRIDVYNNKGKFAGNIYLPKAYLIFVENNLIYVISPDRGINMLRIYKYL